MMIHNRYTISIGRVSRMFESGNKRLILKFGWLPGILIKKYYARLLVDIAELVNIELLEHTVSDYIVKLRLMNRINNLLPSLYYLLAFTDKNDVAYHQFKKFFGKPYEGENDLKLITEMINNLAARLKELDRLGGANANQNIGDGIGFEQVIVYCETILERHIPRDLKLYEFGYIYKSAVKRARELQRSASKSKKKGGL